MDVVEQLKDLARNLWWTWQPEVIAVFQDIDPERWRGSRHNPVAFLANLPQEKIESAVRNQALEARINQAFHQLRTYLQAPGTWGRLHGGPLKNRPVAYLSAEFGLHESLPLYSGGLGVLAGDHLATASDLGIPLVGVGLFYARGYFTQSLDADGVQHESHDEINIADLPLDPLTGENGDPFLVEIDISDRPIKACLWRADVGRCSLILLDCDTAENDENDRTLTDRLYDADPENRLRQEAVLGIGGVRALRLLGIRPGIIHMNEGHSAFSVLELMRYEVEHNGVDFDEAKRRVSSRTVFTTHTPVEAGHDRFAPELVERTFGDLRGTLGLSKAEFLLLGQQQSGEDEPFCMTTLALRFSSRTNAVSALHGRTARNMWRPLWPKREESEVPIGHITNGVHVSSWLAPPLFQFYTRCLGPGWKEAQSIPDTWAPIAQVDDEQLWEMHQILKARLRESLVRWVRRQETRRHGDGKTVDELQEHFQPDILTIAFARRFAAYKRANLIFSDEERLAALVNHAEKPIRLVFAGKAHPRDQEGKDLVKRLFQLSKSEPFRGKLVFIEDYDINVARHLAQGCDLWLNTPLRGNEACGTSGMKAMFNGVLNMSVEDGWWAEAYDGTNGFSIGEGEAHADPEEQNRRDAESLYETLEQEVVPIYYDRNKNDVPCRWTRMLKNAILTLGWRFNADRMMIEYARECYLPAAGVKGLEAVQHRKPLP